ncbi:MAG: hypothetical protein RLZZ488_2261 [Pseudomonadota bacterium]|jgi:hypothetical protein
MSNSDRFFHFRSGIIGLSLLTQLAAGCASLRSVSVTSIPQNRSEQVKANVSKWVVLGLNFNNDYVDQLTEQLRSKCNGKVTGILTKYESTLYFIATKDEITATGFCLDAKRARSAATDKSGGAK